MRINGYEPHKFKLGMKIYSIIGSGVVSLALIFYTIGFIIGGMLVMFQ